MEPKVQTAPNHNHAELYADAGASVEPSAAEQAAEVAQARRMAERYRLPFLDAAHFSIDHELFRSIPADLMLRYGFVPYRRDGPPGGTRLTSCTP